MEIDGGVYSSETRQRIAIRSGWTTVLHLCGGLVLGFASAIAVDNIPLNIHAELLTLGGIVILLAIMSLTSFRWGSTMAKLSGFGSRSRAASIGALSYPIVVFLAAIALLAGEGLFGIGIPIHVLYGMLFVPSAFLIVAVVAAVLGRALSDWQLGGRLAIRAAPTAGITFLLVFLAMDTVGYRVGAPGAEERATMITVTFLACIGAAAAGGASLGHAMRKFSQES